MLPSFAIDGGIALPLARALTVAALLSLFGTLAFRALVVPRCLPALPVEVAGLIRRRLLRLVQGSVGVALLGSLAWLGLQSADMAGATTVAGTLAAMPTVLAQTAYGHLLALQVVALLAAGVAARGQGGGVRQLLALGAAALALAAQAGHSHAASMQPRSALLLAAEIVHLFGAAAWLGGLAPLLIVVGAAPAKAGALAARWFSPLGKLCLVALTATAAYQGWVLVGDVPGLVGTAYGWTALVKLGLFGVLFAFALANRYHLAPALLQEAPGAKPRLLRSIAVQTGFGLAIVAAASVLSSLPPAMHEQPVWPFPDLFTLDTVQEDPEFRNEVLGAVLALAGAAVLLVIAALLRRRVRWVAVFAAVGIAWLAVPHLSLLFVPAYPTSFFRSPTAFATASIVQGADLFPQHCAVCHGTAGRGDGPAAKGLPVPPADLTAAHLWMHSDGELFWWLAHGIEAPEGGVAMPGFAGILSDEDRWSLIDYIRAHNAGVAFAASGAWPLPVQAPGFVARCAGDRTVALSDLHGDFVRLVIGAVPGPSVPGVTTVAATSDPAAQPGPGLCIASDEGVPRAYGVVVGLPGGALPGTQFIIDGDGWLRAMQPPGTAPGWNDPAVLGAEIRERAAHPLAAPEGSHAHMQM